MVKYLVLKPVGDKPIAAITCEDAFVFTGKLKDCPEWVADMTEDGRIVVKNNKLKVYISEFLMLSPGDILIRHNENKYSQIKGEDDDCIR